MNKNKLPAVLGGTITHYQGLGRSLGYPTANFQADSPLMDGVYFGFAEMLEFVHHPSLIFIGTPTTVGAFERRVEAHLLDISDKDYYGESIRLNIVKFHRMNQTFADMEVLKLKMADDEKQARVWFDNNR